MYIMIFEIDGKKKQKMSTHMADGPKFYSIS